MGSLLLCVQLALLCTLSVKADVQPQKDFNLQKFAGKWYRVGLAYDSPAFMPYRDKLRVAMGILRPMDNGDVNVTMWSLSLSPRSPGCYSQVYVYEKMAVPGLFSYFSTRHNRVKDITIVETNYNEYALVLKHKNRLDKDFTQVALYGRTLKLRPELVEKFRQFALSRGFSKESIVIPPAEDDCPNEG
ncbi:neutrophil gelatinase-associated lipocalin [Amia ocellicauda]|uniref:neutrophil gelatinase-associated lipocalin n=1 Tax=Amia ocellicauda TaxID=2972642 RepID=UPI003463ABCC